MGVKINAQQGSSSEYVSAISTVNYQILLRQKSPWLWSDFIYSYTSFGKCYYKALKILHGFTTGVINKRIMSRNKSFGEVRRRFSEDLSTRSAFLDILLDLYDKGEIDIEGIREEVDTFMFEGHDTTAAGISWALYHLGQNPIVLMKLQAEFDVVSQKDGDLIDNILECKYLEYVIKEALRLHPPVPVYARVLDKDIVVNGNTIPKGTDIGIYTIALHMNPDYWDDPGAFNPDRFADEKFLKRNPYCYLPFSVGPRNCIGQKFAMLEAKIVLYHIAYNFDLHSTQEESEVRWCLDGVLKSANGLMIELSQRHK